MMFNNDDRVPHQRKKKWPNISIRTKITFHFLVCLSERKSETRGFTIHCPLSSFQSIARACPNLSNPSLSRLILSSHDGDNDDLRPLFADQTTTHNNLRPSQAMLRSIRRVRSKLFPALEETSHDDACHNNDLLKLIVQLGMNYQQKQQKSEEDLLLDITRSYHRLERVQGCIATVHLRTSLIPISNQSIDDPKDFRVTVTGTADAMLSGGLLAILADVLCNNIDDNNGQVVVLQKIEHIVTAEDVLNLKPENFTSTMGLQTVLSRGRNDGMASMIRLVQRQITDLIMMSDDKKTFDSQQQAVNRLDDTELNKSMIKSLVANKEHRDNVKTRPSVAMLLSGGVDSSVALHLLLAKNYNVTAFYLRIWLEDELAHLGECPWEDDLRVCQAVCEHAGNVPLEVVSLGKEYREQVVQYTIDEAQRGRTPNPDIMCNSRVKFGCFLDYIENNGMEFDYIASGHYARLEDEPLIDEQHPPRKRLFRAPDPIKDQSYFLCTLTQRQLSKVLFPIGTYQKSEVRALATHFQLPNRNRPDSQGLCFLGKVRFDDFLESYLGKRPGDVVDALSGEVIGHHNGLWYHTIGQRKGIGKVISPFATARGPWYVVAKDQRRDIVYVSNRYDENDFAKARSEFEVEDLKWLIGEPPVDAKESCSALSWKEIVMDMKIRHGPSIVNGTLLLKDTGSTGCVRLAQKDGGLAPGQYVVFYRSGTDECLGAGIISDRHWTNFLSQQNDNIS